jgi:hypothetical protein
MRWFLSIGAKYLWDALDEPENWAVGEHEAEYRKRLTMWVANGAFFFDGRPISGTPRFTGLIERHILYWKYKRMVNKIIAISIMRQMAGGK